MREPTRRPKCHSLAAPPRPPSSDKRNNISCCPGDGGGSSTSTMSIECAASQGVDRDVDPQQVRADDGDEQEAEDEFADQQVAATLDRHLPPQLGSIMGGERRIAQLRKLELIGYNDNQLVGPRFGASVSPRARPIGSSMGARSSGSSGGASCGGGGGASSSSSSISEPKSSNSFKGEQMSKRAPISGPHCVYELAPKPINPANHWYLNHMTKWRRKRRWKLANAFGVHDCNPSGKLKQHSDRHGQGKCAKINGSNISLYQKSVFVSFVLVTMLVHPEIVQSDPTRASSADVEHPQPPDGGGANISMNQRSRSLDDRYPTVVIDKYKPPDARPKLTKLINSNEPSISGIVISDAGAAYVEARASAKQTHVIGGKNNTSHSERTDAQISRQATISHHWSSLRGKGSPRHGADSNKSRTHDGARRHHLELRHRRHHYEPSSRHQRDHKRRSQPHQLRPAWSGPVSSSGAKMLLLPSSSSSFQLPQQVNAEARPQASAAGVQVDLLGASSTGAKLLVHGENLLVPRAMRPPVRRQRGFSNFGPLEAPTTVTNESGGQLGGEPAGGLINSSSNNNNNLPIKYDDNNDNNGYDNNNNNNSAPKPINQGSGASELAAGPDGAASAPAEPVSVATMEEQDGASVEPLGPAEPDQQRAFDEDLQNQAGYQQNGADEPAGPPNMELYSGALDGPADNDNGLAPDADGGPQDPADFDDDQQQSLQRPRSRHNPANFDQLSLEETCEDLDKVLATRPNLVMGLLFALCYSVIFIFGLMGNVITLYVLACKGRRCTVQDILIANLACSDVMLCVFAVPVTPKYLIRDGYWTLGPALCKVVSFAQSTSVYMSTYSLICIGYIRYRLIIHPLEESMSKRTALLFVLGTWLVGIIVTLPFMLSVKLIPEPCEYKYCDETWAQPYRLLFSLFTVSFQFMIPLGSVCFFNKEIYSKLDDRSRNREQTSVGPVSSSGCGGGGRGAPISITNADSHSIMFDESTGRQQSVSTKLNPLEASGCQPAGRISELKNGTGHPERNQLHNHQARLHQRNHSFSSLIRSPSSTGHNNTNPASDGANNLSAATKHQMDVIAIREQRKRDKEKRMRKANNRLMIVVIAFAHSWLPLNMFNLVQDYFDAVGDWEYHTHAFLFAHIIACSSVCWNPILYAWMSETYRQDVRNALPRFLVARIRCLWDPHHGQHHHHQGMSSTTGAGYVGIRGNLTTATTSGGHLCHSSGNYLNAINGHATPGKKTINSLSMGPCKDEPVVASSVANYHENGYNVSSPTRLRSNSATSQPDSSRSSGDNKLALAACGVADLEHDNDTSEPDDTRSAMGPEDLTNSRDQPPTCCAGLDSLDLIVDDDEDVDVDFDDEDANIRYVGDRMV